MITDPTKLPSVVWADGCSAYTLYENENFCVKQESMAPDSSEQLHQHLNVRQVFYILQGKAVFVLNNRVHQLSSGKFITVTPGAAHQIRNRSNEQLSFLVISSPPVNNDRTTL